MNPLRHLCNGAPAPRHRITALCLHHRIPCGVESLLSAMVDDRMTDGHHRPNAEVLPQGIANIGLALFGGLTATGANARTATNIRAGGKTPVPGLVHAGTILFVMWVTAPLAGYLAMPALAALMILTAWNMSEPHKWRGYLAPRRSDRFLLLITMTLTVVVHLTVAIAVWAAPSVWRCACADGAMRQRTGRSRTGDRGSGC